MMSSKLIRFAIILQALYAYFPILRALPFPIRVALRMVPLLLVFVGFALLKDRNKWYAYWGIMFFAVFLGFIRSMVYASGTGESIINNCINSILYWNCLIEGYYVVVHFKEKESLNILNLVVRAVAITSITSIIFSLINPGSIRSSTSFYEEDFAYYIYNVGTYSFIYSIVFLIPVLVFSIRNKTKIIGKNGNTLIMMIVFEILVVIFLSQFAIALGLALIGLFLCLLGNKRYKTFKKEIFRYSVLGVVLLFLFIPLIGVLAVHLNGMEMDELSERFLGVYQLFTGGVSAASGDVGARFFLYKLSIQHFVNNPLFGLWGELGFKRATAYGTRDLLNEMSQMTLGQHSALIDLLGGNGLLGFLPFCFIVFFLWKKIKKYAVSDFSIVCMFTVFVLYYAYGFLDHAFSCFDVALSVFVLSPMIIKIYPPKNNLQNTQLEHENTYNR